MATATRSLRKHDTPQSPHREHMKGGSRSGGFDINTVSDEGRAAMRDAEEAGFFEVEGGIGTFEVDDVVIGEMDEKTARSLARRIGARLRVPGQKTSEEWGPGWGPAATRSLRKAVADCTVATISLVEAVEQPEHFDSGDRVVPTGEPSGDLGKRPQAKGAETTDDVFPETGDPDSGDAVAHVAYPDEVVDGRSAYKSLGQVARSATAVAKAVGGGGGKKGIAADVAETMDDLSGALHELREVEQALVARRQRTQDQDTEIEDARELSASVGR